MQHIFRLFFFLFSFWFTVSIDDDQIQEPWEVGHTRTNFCSIAKTLLMGGDFKSALTGANVTIAVDPHAPALYMTMDEESGLPVSGLLFDIQQSLANELNFNINYVLVPPITPDVNWNVRLMRVLKHVDLYGSIVFSGMYYVYVVCLYN